MQPTFFETTCRAGTTTSSDVSTCSGATADLGSMGSRRAAGGGALGPSPWQRGPHPSRHGRLPLRSRRPASAAPATSWRRQRHHRRREVIISRGQLPRPQASNTGPLASMALRVAARWSQAPTIDTNDPALRDGLCEGSGEVQAPSCVGTRVYHPNMHHQPYDWTPSGLPCYRSGEAPRFLVMRSDLTARGLIPRSAPVAQVDSQHGPAALYLITDSTFSEPDAWPPRAGS